MSRYRVNIITPEHMLHSPFERYFKYDKASDKWDMSGYNPVFIEGKISIQQVEDFLAKLDIKGRPSLANEKYGCCDMKIFDDDLKAYHAVQAKLFEEENEKLWLLGMHWEWGGGSNKYYYVPCLILDFQKQRFSPINGQGPMMQQGNELAKGMGNPLMYGDYAQM